MSDDLPKKDLAGWFVHRMHGGESWRDHVEDLLDRHRLDALAEQAAEIAQLRELMERSAKSLERNLYRQREKLEWIAPALRAALSAQPSEQEGGA